MDLGKESVHVAHTRAAVSCLAPGEVLYMMFTVWWTSIIFRVGNKLATHCFWTFRACHRATADFSSILNERVNIVHFLCSVTTCFF